MKFVHYLILFITLYTCRTKKAYDFYPFQKIEQGKCYYKILPGDTVSSAIRCEGPFLVEIEPPQFKKVKAKFKVETLINLYKEDSFQIQIKDAYCNYMMVGSVVKTKLEFPLGYLLCLEEMNGEFKVIRKSDIIKMKYLELDVYKLKKNAQIIKRNVKELPGKLKTNQSFFQKGYWMEWKECIYGGECDLFFSWVQ